MSVERVTTFLTYMGSITGRDKDILRESHRSYCFNTSHALQNTANLGKDPLVRSNHICFWPAIKNLHGENHSEDIIPTWIHAARGMWAMIEKWPEFKGILFKKNCQRFRYTEL